MDKIKIGVSACLMGENVRYDGGNKYNPLIIEAFGDLFEFVRVCPEAGAGLGVPREPMRLEGYAASPRMVTAETGIDHTGRILDWEDGRLASIEKEGVCGFILKARSPSCGLSVPVFSGEVAAGETSGLFVKALKERFPGIPLMDEEGLRDPAARREFLERVILFKNVR